MKKTTLLLLLLFMASCTKTKSEKLVPFFKFDEVIHYQIDDEDSISKLFQENKDERTESDKEFLKILMEYNYPLSFFESSFFNSLEKLYPKKNQVSTSLFPELSKIFSQNNVSTNVEYACEPFFRDIFIFKNNNKIIGVAKICLECGKSSFLGTNGDTQNFGSNGEFEKLKKVIEKINPVSSNDIDETN